MSRFIIKSEVLQRLSKLIKKDNLIKFELSNHKILLIVCDESVACVEYLGDVDSNDESFYIQATEKLLRGLEFEVNTDSDLVIETTPELAIATFRSMSGNDYTESIKWFDSTIYDNWRSWFVAPEGESKGFMYWSIYQLIKLFESSPSGEIVFPKVINSSKPVIIRDVNSDKWLGAFIPKSDSDKKIVSAEVPDWLN